MCHAIKQALIDSCAFSEAEEDAEAERLRNRDPQQLAKEILQERIDLYKIEIEENELNLRRNIILGGVFYFDMLEIPPQPKRVGDWIICQLESPQVKFNKVLSSALLSQLWKR